MRPAERPRQNAGQVILGAAVFGARAKRRGRPGRSGKGTAPVPPLGPQQSTRVYFF